MYATTSVCAFQKPRIHWFHRGCLFNIDKKNPFVPIKCKDYWRQILKSLTLHGLNNEENVECFRFYLVHLSSFWFIIFDTWPLVLGLQSFEFMLLLLSICLISVNLVIIIVVVI